MPRPLLSSRLPFGWLFRWRLFWAIVALTREYQQYEKAGRRRAIVHAAVVNFRVRPGRMGEAVRTCVGSVIPAMREQQGFRGTLV